MCCELSPLQKELYRHFLRSQSVSKLLSGKNTGSLPAITCLKKLCNCPQLVYPKASGYAEEKVSSATAGLADCAELFPAGITGSLRTLSVDLSSKLCVLNKMLINLKCDTDDKIGETCHSSSFASSLSRLFSQSLLSSLCKYHPLFAFLLL